MEDHVPAGGKPEPPEKLKVGKHMKDMAGDVQQHSVDAFGDVGRHAKDMAAELQQHTQDALSDVGDHAQGLTGEVVRHSQDAASEVRREVPVLVEHVKETFADLFGGARDGGEKK